MKGMIWEPFWSTRSNCPKWPFRTVSKSVWSLMMKGDDLGAVLVHQEQLPQMAISNRPNRLFHGPLGNEHFELGAGRNLDVSGTFRSSSTLVVASLGPLSNEHFEPGVGRNFGASVCFVDRTPCGAGTSPICVQKGMLVVSIRAWPSRLATSRGLVFTAGWRPVRYPRDRRFAAGTFCLWTVPGTRRRCQRCKLNL